MQAFSEDTGIWNRYAQCKLPLNVVLKKYAWHD